ncbi:putative Ig domain-containing protein, partial [Novipirellula rosea]|uniref:putative Ig domain-containing protein n=1 Tax=Novipirellula rosea TaxID=1031540 RepID=UPI0031EB50FE
LTFSLANGAGSVPAGAVINPATGAFSWTPSEAQDGVHTFDVVVSDGNGGSDSETITITVGEVNAAPTLAPIGDKVIAEGTSQTFTAAGSDSDLVSGSPQTLTYGLSSEPAFVTIDSGTGVVTLSPVEADGPGVYTFNVTVNDGTATTSQTITVTVVEANVAPVLDVSAAPTAAVDEGT